MYANIPLAVISSMPAGEAEETCIEAGADIYIEKSAAPNESVIKFSLPPTRK
jgi:hypothetical protein